MTSAPRRHALGGTDVAAILGLSPFRSPYDVWLDKSGLNDDRDRSGNERTQWGKRLERVIAEAYTETTGRPHEWLDRTFGHPKFEHGCWTPDALLTQDNGGLDAKTCGPDQGRNWGDPQIEPDSVPDYIATQAHWYMSASEREFWDIALLVGGSDLRIYRIPRDREIEGVILDEARQWWAKHITEGVPPEMTCTPATEAYLKRRFPRGSGTLRVPNGNEAAIIEQFLEAREWKHDAETAYGDAEVRLKAAIGDDDGFSFSGGRITFKRTKDTVGVDWEALAKWAAGDDYARLAKQFYGVTRQGSRRLDVRVSEGKW